MTIFILAVLTILVVGFLSTMSTERQAASAYEETQRTKLVAQGAVAHAINLLQTNIPDPARLAEGPATAPGENWITNPGRLTIVKSGQSPIHIPLHTGEITNPPAPGALRDAESVDLNKPLPGQTAPAIVPAASGSTHPVMRVKWVNVPRDPSATVSKDNQLSARYAFWIDDESTKLNFNTAVGKPARGQDNVFSTQLTAGFMPPIFSLGDGATTYGGGDRNYSLGKPQSVNLDVLLDDPNQLLRDKLIAHTFLQGFARSPESIMDFVNVTNKRDWFNKNKFNLTFYSRSPEFNAFGWSRLFTSYIPLSLEAGPSYQHPFIYDPNATNGVVIPNGVEGDLVAGTLESGRLKDEQILNLNSLLGFFGASADITGPTGYKADKANMVNRNQVRVLRDYFRRKWPGYDKSFVEKYGEMECFQLALNILQFARMSTTMLGNNLANFSNDWSYRSTSVNYFPNGDELGGYAPERFYWRIKDPDTGKVKLMLPQMPGPHITEVRLFVQSVTPDHPPKTGTVNANSRYIKYWYETEYYMHPFGPVVDISYFPVRMDYLDVSARTSAGGSSQQFGPTNGTDTRADRQWQNQYMDLLASYPANDNVVYPNPSTYNQTVKTTLGPTGATWASQAVRNRLVIQSPKFTVGVAKVGGRDVVSRKDNKIDKTNFPGEPELATIWDPVLFDKSAGSSARVAIRFRPGQGILGAANRPRQMIPLGLTQADTLQGNFTLDLNSTAPQVISWQIEDPRLSHDLTKWVITGPGVDSATGTPGELNLVTGAGAFKEPAETSDEKSKFRYIQRTPADSKISNYGYDRPDEYVTTSRVSSPGYWSLLHTGMQSGVPWRTLNLGGDTTSAASNSPPDWLLLDLLGATYPMAHDQWKIDEKLPDSFSTASYMSSTAGQVNLNSRIYPQNQWFNPPARTLPLTGVFKELRAANRISAFVTSIGSYQTDSKFFNYVGELSNVPGYTDSAGTQWLRETFLRNMAGVLTTRTNTFGVWGVAQTLKKNVRNSDYATFESGDRVTGEKRFFALVERYVWPGKDGVPGNAHLTNVGTWDRQAKQTAKITTQDGMTDTLFQLPGSPPLKRASATAERLDVDPEGTYPEYDGPEPVGMDAYTAAALGSVAYRKTSLEDAHNPPQAVIKYRVVYFKYLDE